MYREDPSTWTVYHKSKKVKEFVESYTGKIILVYLPSYMPELNPCLLYLKNGTANTLYKSVVAMNSEDV